MEEIIKVMTLPIGVLIFILIFLWAIHRWTPPINASVEEMAKSILKAILTVLISGLVIAKVIGYSLSL